MKKLSERPWSMKSSNSNAWRSRSSRTGNVFLDVLGVAETGRLFVRTITWIWFLMLEEEKRRLPDRKQEEDSGRKDSTIFRGYQGSQTTYDPAQLSC